MAKFSFVLLLLLGLSGPVKAQQFINAYFVAQPQDVLMTLLGTGVSTVTVQATGGATLTGAFRVSDDGTNWIAITGYPLPTGAGTSSLTGDGYWSFATAGHRFLQIHITAITGGEYFTLAGAPGGQSGSIPQATVTGAQTKTGPDQHLSVTSSSVTIPTIPAGTTGINIWPVCAAAASNGVAIYFETDGSAPTNTSGNPLFSGQVQEGWPIDVANLQFIAANGASGCSVTLNTYK